MKILDRRIPFSNHELVAAISMAIPKHTTTCWIKVKHVQKTVLRNYRPPGRETATQIGYNRHRNRYGGTLSRSAGIQGEEFCVIEA